MASPSLSFPAADVARALRELDDSFTMIEFLSSYTGSFVSDVGDAPGESVNVANAKAAAAALRAAGCTKTGQRAARDADGHRTTTSTWSKT